MKLEDQGRRENGLSLPQLYLLKCMRERKPVCDLQKLCTALADPISNLNKIEWQKTQRSTKLGYCPLGYVEYYMDAIRAILELLQTQENRSKVDDMLAVAQSSPSHRLAFLAAAASIFYFRKTVTSLTDVDKKTAELLFQATGHFSDIYRQFLEKILGLSDFTGMLQLSESSSQKDVEMASVILHLVAVIVSHAGNKTTSPTAFMAFTNQSVPLDEMQFLATGEQCSGHQEPPIVNVEYHDCQCGLRMVGNDKSKLPNDCIACHKPRKPQSTVGPSVGPNQEESNRENSSSDSNPPLQAGDTNHKLSPVAYRTLDTLLHSCLLAGFCSGMSTEEQMLSLFKVLRARGMLTEAQVATSDVIGNDDTNQQNEPSAQDVQQLLTARVQENWRMLRNVLQLNEEGVSLFLHRIIRTSKHEIVARCCPRSAQDSESLQNALSDIINFEARSIPQCLHQQKHDCLEAEEIDMGCLESKLEELNPDPENTNRCAPDAALPEAEDTNDNCNANEEYVPLRHLFQKTQKASLKNLCSTCENMSQSERSNYPFLQLCLSRLELIEYVRFLPDLVNWNTLVVRTLNHMIKRDEAKGMTVSDFLSNDRYFPTEPSRDAASLAFDAFKTAWNQIKDMWCKLTGDDSAFGYMTPTNTITDCFVDKKEQNCTLRQMINALLDVQNAFLMDALGIATNNHCPALVFVLKDEGIAGMKILASHAAGASIIQFKWSNDLLAFHDVETEYGYGSVIKYKYSVIERELARILVLNKAILVEGTALIQFEYLDELFHACSAILSEIGTTILQQKLPQDLINIITREQNRRQTFAKDMLDHLEVILALLKKTGSDPGVSLDDYIKRWATQLPRSFSEDLLPEPRDGVKLQHVVHLYELLEDFLVNTVVESLPVDYRSNLSEPSSDFLNQKMEPLSVEQLEAMASTLRRFTFRFIRSDTVSNTTNNLKELIMRSARETMDCSIFTDVLPDDLEVKHVVKTLDTIDKQIEQRKVANQKENPQIRPVGREGTTTTNRARGRQRRRQFAMGGVS